MTLTQTKGQGHSKCDGLTPFVAGRLSTTFCLWRMCALLDSCWCAVAFLFGSVCMGRWEEDQFKGQRGTCAFLLECAVAKNARRAETNRNKPAVGCKHSQCNQIKKRDNITRWGKSESITGNERETSFQGMLSACCCSLRVVEVWCLSPGLETSTHHLWVEFPVGTNNSEVYLPHGKDMFVQKQ